MKNIKKWVQFLREDLDTPEMIEQKDDTQVSAQNKIEIPQDRWNEWSSKIDQSATYTSCEMYIDENKSILTINNPSITLNGEAGIMIRYTKTDQKDNDLENKLETLKEDGAIERVHFLSPVNPEGFLTHIGNLKSLSK